MKYSDKEIHNKVNTILKKANAIFKKAFLGDIEIYEQEGVQLSTSVVTATDLEIDAYLRNKLQKAFPEFGFITEEKKEKTASRKEYNWIIDPIDGTANFAHKIPICGISIALWKRDDPVYGIISYPMLGETVYAIKDKGVFLNDISARKTKKQITSMPYILYAHVGADEEKLKIHKVIPPTSKFKCAAYQLTLVALGRADCSISVNLPIWDIAAGLLIAKEAGKHIEFVSPLPSLSQSDFREYKNTFVIGNKKLASKIANKIKKVLEA